jgi:hypothetical protein
LGKLTINELAKKYKRSKNTVIRLCDKFLSKPPVPQIKENNDCHLIIDGTYHSDICLLNYLDNDLKHLQYYEIGDETERNFRSGLKLLKAAGLKIASITSDGHKELILAIREVYPGMKDALFTSREWPDLINGILIIGNILMIAGDLSTVFIYMPIPTSEKPDQ